MLAQAFDIPDFESRAFRGRDHIVRRGELAVREDVSVDERIRSPELPEDFLAQRISAVAPLRLTMPWFMNSPPGLSARNAEAKYTGRWLAPTCSTMPMLEILS